MISPKFVNIAREVVRFIRNDHKLTQHSIYLRNNSCCPLGAVCVNHNAPVFCEDRYDFAHKKTGLSHYFQWGFDYYGESFSLNEEYTNNEDFIIGYKLAEMCANRNWIV